MTFRLRAKCSQGVSWVVSTYENINGTLRYCKSALQEGYTENWEAQRRYIIYQRTRIYFKRSQAETKKSYQYWFRISVAIVLYNEWLIARNSWFSLECSILMGWLLLAFRRSLGVEFTTILYTANKQMRLEEKGKLLESYSRHPADTLAIVRLAETRNTTRNYKDRSCEVYCQPRRLYLPFHSAPLLYCNSRHSRFNRTATWRIKLKEKLPHFRLETTLLLNYSGYLRYIRTFTVRVRIYSDISLTHRAY